MAIASTDSCPECDEPHRLVEDFSCRLCTCCWRVEVRCGQCGVWFPTEQATPVGNQPLCWPCVAERAA